jgi:predicted RNA-binding Zn ribbon-like protein
MVTILLMEFSSRSFVGGALCLDFVNTVGGIRTGEAIEHLRQYEDLIGWSSAAGSLPPDIVAQVREAAISDPEAALDELGRAKRFRESLYAVLKAGVSAATRADPDLKETNAVFSATLGRRRLIVGPAGFTSAWDYRPPDLSALIWPVAQSAFDFIAAGRAGAVRECAGHDCGWLFVDLSKNRRRTWCDMQGCGNRAKIRRFRSKAV